MPEEKGQIISSGEAWLYVYLPDGRAIECALDTGFYGWLSWPRKIVEKLALPHIGEEVVEIFGGARESCELVAADIIWLGEHISVPVLVSESEDTLIGTSLLKNTILRINYCNGKVSIKPCKPRR